MPSFFFNDTATTEIYTLSLHDALPIYSIVRIYLGLIGLGAWLFQAAQAPAPAVVQDLTHLSQVLGGTRTYQVLLPPAYATSKKRYPVVYWFHGYEQSNQARDEDTASYVATHDVIVVRTGPVETQGSYPLYFPELVD